MVSIRKDSFNIQGLNLTSTSGAKKAEAATTAKVKQPLFNFSEKGDDLLTKNLQNIYGAQSVQASYNKTIADDTNAILKNLGYNLKVAPSQVASVANGYNTVVAPGMQRAADGAVAANIQNPNGPFAELFA